MFYMFIALNDESELLYVLMLVVGNLELDTKL